MQQLEDGAVYAIDGGFFRASYIQDHDVFVLHTYLGLSGYKIGRTGLAIDADGTLHHRIWDTEASEHTLISSTYTVDDLEICDTTGWEVDLAITPAVRLQLFVEELMSLHSAAQAAIDAGMIAEFRLESDGYIAIQQVKGMANQTSISFMRYDAHGHARPDPEIICYISPYTQGWYPLAIYRHWGEYQVYAQNHCQADQPITVFNYESQQRLAQYADALAYGWQKRGWLIESEFVSVMDIEEEIPF